MYQKFLEGESLSRTMDEAIMAKQQDALAEFKMASPEERNMQLQKDRPDLIRQVQACDLQ